MMSTPPITNTEKYALTRWGAYLTEAEERFLLRAIDLATASHRGVEIGSEGGRWSLYLAERGWTVTCIDIVAKYLALCQERMPHARCLLVEPDDERWPVDDASADLLLAYEVPYVTSAGWFPSEAARVVAPGGLLLLTVINPRSLRGTGNKLLQAVDARRAVERAYRGPSYSAVRASLRAAGFDVIAELGMAWAPFTRDSNSRLIATFTALERRLRLNRLVTLSPWCQILLRRR